MTTESLVRNVAYQLRQQSFLTDDGTFNSDNEYLQL